MIRDEDTAQALVDTVARFVRERLVPLEHQVADNDLIPPTWCRTCARWACSASPSPKPTAAWA